MKIKNLIPETIKENLGVFVHARQHPFIIKDQGKLDPFKSKITFVMIVGYTFDQRRPDAMMTCRIGYCNGFEAIGIPYIIVDIKKVKNILPKIPNPICMLYGVDLIGIDYSTIRFLRNYPSGIWVQPWFKQSKKFFLKHGLDYKTWTFNDKLITKILSLESKFGFTATVPSGMNFFEEWEQNGLSMKSLPLACDTAIYNEKSLVVENNFRNVELAFVGGYWKSKGVQIDYYLRPLEDKLTIFGYSKWPYKGYQGLLETNLEPTLYYESKVCPVINEPTVALMKGQINERVFKVLGSGGCPVVDAVPAYKELYTEDELLVAESQEHFLQLTKMLLNDSEINLNYRKRGREATLARHTYKHRANDFLKNCELPEAKFSNRVRM